MNPINELAIRALFLMQTCVVAYPIPADVLPSGISSERVQRSSPRPTRAALSLIDAEVHERCPNWVHDVGDVDVAVFLPGGRLQMHGFCVPPGREPKEGTGSTDLLHSLNHASRVKCDPVVDRLAKARLGEREGPVKISRRMRT